ncbi:MAG: calcium/sodium antiporter [Oscillospiraceae bacterium]|nr:calcium/sodium antiporter [Oscillospiraceae bacterium]
MTLWLALILFTVGILLVVKGGDWFVDAAGRLARAFGVPPFIIGATVVSLATTMPEMIVSVLSAVQGKTDMAVGNAVGSVTANTALILGLAMVFMPVALPRRDYLGQCLLLIGAAAVLLAGCGNGYLTVWAGVALLCLLLAFMEQTLRSASRERENAARPVAGTGIEKEGGIFLLGAAAIVGGSQLLVRSGAAIAAALGAPERVIAVTLMAVGTSLPELATTVTAIRKREAGFSVGNIIGANLIDLTLILPVCSAVSGRLLPVAAACMRIDLPACLLVTALAFIPLLIRQRGGRIQGILLLAAYGAYLIVTA